MLSRPGAGAPIETGLSMAMVAGGGRGQILGGGDGFGLAFKADALWVGTRTTAATGPGGNLASTRAAVSRLRTAIEGSQRMSIASRMALTPSIEIGIRQDGGDADTGRGMDLGAGLVLADSVTGLAVDIRVRRLLVHEAAGFAESGMSISVSYNPTPSTPLGFTARVSPVWGGESMSGAEALWGRETMAGMAHGGVADGTRLEAEVGYGLPVGSRLVGTPRVGVGTSEHGRDYRLGYRLGALGGEGTAFELGVDAQRRESPLQGGTDHGAPRTGHAAVVEAAPRHACGAPWASQRRSRRRAGARRGAVAIAPRRITVSQRLGGDVLSRRVVCSALVVAAFTLAACRVQTQNEHRPASHALADLRASAEAGDAEAQCILGGLNVTGASVPQDAAAAVAWYRQEPLSRCETLRSRTP